MRWRRGTTLTLVAFGFTSATNANPWPKDDGVVEIISSAIVTRQSAGLTGGASANAFSELHLEYGATADATIILDASMQQYVLANRTQTNFDTAWVGGRTPILRWDNALLSLEAELGLSGIRESVASNARQVLDGTGELRLMFGQGFELFERHAFAGVEAGWHWRAGPPADEAFFDATAGIEPWPAGLLMVQSFAILGSGAAYGSYSRYDLLKLQLSLAQRITPHWWVQAGAISTVAGADAGETGVVFALWWRF